LADGYFVIPYTVGEYLADDISTGKISTDSPEFNEAAANVKSRIDALMNTKGTKSVDSFHKRLGKIMWDECGMSRNEKGLKKAIADIRALRDEFYKNVRVPGKADAMNQELEKALRVADFIELGELMCLDALDRNESCGGHFREESQTPEGEAMRKDDEFAYVAAWEYKNNDPGQSVLHKEDLVFENVKLVTRSYK
jgi:succinate dehydrogenase / fumarate reductase flavoprotein subunit